MRNLTSKLYGRTQGSGRGGWDKRKGPFVPKKADREAILGSLITLVSKNDSICPTCKKVIDLRLGVLENGDEEYVPFNPQAPSCDRIENHGKEYLIYNGVNNIQQTHRKCNTERRDTEVWDFSCDNSDWNPSTEEVKEIQARNREMMANNFLIEIKNNKQMNNSHKIKMLELGMRMVANLSFTVVEVEAAIKSQLGNLTPSKVGASNGTVKSSRATARLVECLKQTGFDGTKPFTGNDMIAAGTATMYKEGTTPKYMSKVAAKALQEGVLKSVGTVGKSIQYNFA